MPPLKAMVRVQKPEWGCAGKPSGSSSDERKRTGSSVKEWRWHASSGKGPALERGWIG
eukprot:CAMPEP_0198433834 /NCGR_PEP_ID=MMETSP1452-20131203/28741_1 /TAXON_ID=1181717 /ORGANISM="Synchroma pusillum, Strain CCMP3072" /LENGTH=57 /DNA_ID=CAMNT_0044154331 /DNA_START=112 /DNA_END=281 /DNA_ORIENTATION=-